VGAARDDALDSLPAGATLRERLAAHKERLATLEELKAERTTVHPAAPAARPRRCPRHCSRGERGPPGPSEARERRGGGDGRGGRRF
jgi:hypothetical protein